MKSEKIHNTFEDEEKIKIIEKLSKNWNEKLKTDFLSPRFLYVYSLKELKDIEKYYLTEIDIDKDVSEYENDNTNELQNTLEEEIKRRAKEWINKNKKNTSENKPSIFKQTIYRLPNEQELEEFINFPNLTSDDIINGFTYTIIGKGVKNANNNKMIIDSIQMLSDKYPENKEYKKALEIIKLNYNNELIKTLEELKNKYLSNEAVENIRIEDNEIVFDVKCETDVRSGTEYNGFKLRFNYLCDINDKSKHGYTDDENEDSQVDDEKIIEKAKMINESVISEYINEVKKPNNYLNIDKNKIYNFQEYFNLKKLK